MRYKAPVDTHSIDLSSGTLVVDENGFVEAPDELSLGDITGLIANGFLLDPVAPVAIPLETVDLPPPATSARTKPVVPRVGSETA